MKTFKTWLETYLSKKTLQNDINFNSFVQEIIKYQSNHYGYYNRRNLVSAYDNLSEIIKNKIKPKNAKNMFRGTDGIGPSDDPDIAISFSTPNVAQHFGTFLIPFSELQSYKAIIDTNKLASLTNLIGDDEAEIIVLNPVWKQNIENRLEKYRIQRANP